jgi:hypothetical protein
MKNIFIAELGLTVNILIYLYSQATKRDLNMIVPKIYLLFILPLVLMLSLVASAIYSYFKQKSKAQILQRLLIAFLLLLTIISPYYFPL